MDPTLKEEAAASGAEVTVVINTAGQVCAVQQLGGIGLMLEQVMPGPTRSKAQFCVSQSQWSSMHPMRRATPPLFWHMAVEPADPFPRKPLLGMPIFNATVFGCFLPAMQSRWGGIKLMASRACLAISASNQQCSKSHVCPYPA